MTARAPAGADAPDQARPLALSMGDPAGIGLDIALMAWHRRAEHALPPFVFFGDAEALAARARALGFGGLPVEIVSDDLRSVADIFTTRFPVSPVACPASVVPGTPDPTNAPAVIGAIESAVEAVRTGAARAVVTNPISKAVLKAHGFPHPGHTEFLGALAETRFGASNVTPVMLLTSRELSVVPLTIHIPLARVPAAISKQAIEETARILHRALNIDFGIREPRIAITGLNPHAGEQGTMGDEDERIVAPAIATLRRDGLAVSGPHPADTLFHAAARETYDAVLAMYHDQALIPIKTLAFDTGVNVTLGLPFVRTSPDHGTAFSIAATGQARATSLIEALKCADAIATRRESAAQCDGAAR
ncbi:4-hydroxythreonine-4-phosphate dehydrogenase [Hyphomicrobium nitrativorans NL23]|uniref:4-hydroxythreonine-4-phosphate dehydrogenase n=1 Tax=Hyphomicrobium nitrativorans NL23 TaxID=1029756 RepID=V5SD81_9HYPH|nr:4-hydroxythreonine-4-phosphate dehydrogenase PdxA [Hyphomicrobium nitrativorans]AHB48821.1 4-hydroxythreonine-4-phosphate dehydrogenase [Hyphomicrobium nitrativorans NL23]